MPTDMESIFKAKSQSVLHFLMATGQGCYIPAYQRHYSWKKVNVNRLFEDAVHGITQLVTRDNTISFLGTIISMHDKQHKTVQPIYVSEVAPKVMAIIDGQQRICTLIMINIAIHDLARTHIAKLKNKDEAQNAWLETEITRLLGDIIDSFVIDMRTGDQYYQYYPRIIRAYDDVWSTRKGKAKYTSPIALLIHEYNAHFRDQEKSKKIFAYQPKDDLGEDLAKYKTVVDVYKAIHKEILQIINCKHPEQNIPELLALAQSERFCKTIWGYSADESVKKFLSENTDHPQYNLFCNLLRLLILARYINYQMAFTVVAAENEDDAFDMFEALNTTGEPLTAFETFKPKVIEAEEIEKYSESPSYKRIETIENYLERFLKADDKQAATSGLLVPFALSETGYKLSKKLTDQRRYLREQFSDELTSLTDKRDFVHRLADLSIFMKDAWDRVRDEPLRFHSLPPVDDQSYVAFEVLRNLSHTITIAPLFRFFHNALEATDEQDKITKANEFFDAIKATTAFSALWRSAHGGTKNIDNVYRDIMGSVKQISPPLALRPKDGVGSLSITNYKRLLRKNLETSNKNFLNKDEWISEAAKRPIYASSAPLTRFLLFVASHDSVPDDTPGLIKQGKKGYSPMLTKERLDNPDYFTVEHIAPQSFNNGWQKDIYAESDTVNRIGNLTLLPQIENGIAGNRSWEHKRLLYSLLSATDQKEFDACKSECTKAGLNLGKKADEIIANSNYLGLCKSLSLKKDDWTADFIDERSRCLCGIIWEHLHTWLQ